MSKSTVAPWDAEFFDNRHWVFQGDLDPDQWRKTPPPPQSPGVSHSMEEAMDKAKEVAAVDGASILREVSLHEIKRRLRERIAAMLMDLGGVGYSTIFIQDERAEAPDDLYPVPGEVWEAANQHKSGQSSSALFPISMELVDQIMADIEDRILATRPPSEQQTPGLWTNLHPAFTIRHVRKEEVMWPKLKIRVQDADWSIVDVKPQNVALLRERLAPATTWVETWDAVSGHWVVTTAFD